MQTKRTQIGLFSIDPKRMIKVKGDMLPLTLLGIQSKYRIILLKVNKTTLRCFYNQHTSIISVLIEV